MTTWNEPTDIEVEYHDVVYKVRRVTRGHRVWRQTLNGWKPLREGKQHDEIVARAELDALRERF